MKRFIFELLLLIVTDAVLAVETLNPRIEAGTRDASIYSVDVDIDETVVYIDYSPFFKRNSSPYYPYYGNSVNSLWISINRSIVLTYVDPVTKNTVKLHATELEAEYELAFDKKYYFKDFLSEDGKYYPYIFVYFPPIPAGVDKISIYEDERKSNNSVWWENIHINPLTIGKTSLLTSSIDSIQSLIFKTANKHAGIYEKVGDEGVAYTLAYLKKDNMDYLVFIDSDDKNSIWEIGEVKAELRPTVSPNSFKATWYNRDKSKNTKCTITFDEGLMKILLNENVDTYIKMATNSNDGMPENPDRTLWSGTGFALNNGYIVTNYHVIDQAQNIAIYQFNEDGTKQRYVAIVAATDKTNDIAILKINDTNFKGFGKIPYSIKTGSCEVGESVWALGYPMTNIMGDEIKFTDGKISARSGIDGEKSVYQISVPIQPGNSGGPLFDTNGNVVGITSSGLNRDLKTENVNYAIKISYLRLLIEDTLPPTVISQGTSLQGLTLTSQIKLAKKYVLYIECSSK